MKSSSSGGTGEGRVRARARKGEKVKRPIELPHDLWTAVEQSAIAAELSWNAMAVRLLRQAIAGRKSAGGV